MNRLTAEGCWAILSAIPGRLSYIDDQGFDYSPNRMGASTLHRSGATTRRTLTLKIAGVVPVTTRKIRVSLSSLRDAQAPTCAALVDASRIAPVTLL